MRVRVVFVTTLSSCCSGWAAHSACGRRIRTSAHHRRRGSEISMESSFHWCAGQPTAAATWLAREPGACWRSRCGRHTSSSSASVPLRSWYGTFKFPFTMLWFIILISLFLYLYTDFNFLSSFCSAKTHHRGAVAIGGGLWSSAYVTRHSTHCTHTAFSRCLHTHRDYSSS